MHLTAGNKYTLNIAEEEFPVSNGIDFFGQYLFPREETIQDHHELKSIAHVGTMGSGKSTKARFQIDYIRSVWGPENVNAMLTDNLQLAMECMDDKFVQVLMIDDAISKQDSRRSMSSENVIMTQQFMLIRHRADQIRRGGIVYVIFCFQDPTAIDKRFRNNCDIVLYSNYYQDAGLERIIKNKESIQFLKKITREQKMNDFSYRCYAVGRAMWGEVIQTMVPYVPEQGFDINMVSSSGKKDEIKEQLIARIISMNLLDEENSVIYGWLNELKCNDPEMEIYGFTQTDFKEICWRAKARMALGSAGSTKVQSHFSTLIRYAKEKLGLSYIDLERETGIPHTILNRYVKKAEA